MKIISFAWTTPALLAGEKTVTRRDWSGAYAARFRAGEMVAAYDRQPRFRGKQVAVIRLTRTPYLEDTRQAPDDDYNAEGFTYLGGRMMGVKIDGLPPHALWEKWKSERHMLYVVRFELVEVTAEKYEPASPQAVLL